MTDMEAPAVVPGRPARARVQTSALPRGSVHIGGGSAPSNKPSKSKKRKDSSSELLQAGADLSDTDGSTNATNARVFKQEDSRDKKGANDDNDDDLSGMSTGSDSGSESVDSGDRYERIKAEAVEAVMSAPPNWTDRFGEIVWAKQKEKEPYWPSYIYDPRSPTIRINPSCHKPSLVGKKHVVYFFGYENKDKLARNNNSVYGFATTKCILDWKTGEEMGLKTTQKIPNSWAAPWPSALVCADEEFSLPKEQRLSWRALGEEEALPGMAVDGDDDNDSGSASSSDSDSDSASGDDKRSKTEGAHKDKDKSKSKSKSNSGIKKKSRTSDGNKTLKPAPWDAVASTADAYKLSSDSEVDGEEGFKLVQSKSVKRRKHSASEAGAEHHSAKSVKKDNKSGGGDADGDDAKRKRGRPVGSTKASSPRLPSEQMHAISVDDIADISTPLLKKSKDFLSAPSITAANNQAAAAATKTSAPLTREQKISRAVRELEAASGMQRVSKEEGSSAPTLPAGATATATATAVSYKPNPVTLNVQSALQCLDMFLTTTILQRVDLSSTGLLALVRQLRADTYFNDEIRNKACLLFERWKQLFPPPAKSAAAGSSSSSSSSAAAAATASSHTLTSSSISGSSSGSLIGLLAQPPAVALSSSGSHIGGSAGAVGGNSNNNGNGLAFASAAKAAAAAAAAAAEKTLFNEDWDCSLCPPYLHESNIRMRRCMWIHIKGVKCMEASIRVEQACWDELAAGKDNGYSQGYASHINRLNPVPYNNTNFNGSLTAYIEACSEIGFVLAEPEMRKLRARIVLKDHKNPVDLALVARLSLSEQLPSLNT